MKRPAIESPARPVRRTRKTIVIEEDSEDELSLVKEEQDEEFTLEPIAQTSPRKAPRRKTAAEAQHGSPRKVARTRKARSEDHTESKTLAGREDGVSPSDAPTPRASPRKRKTTAPRTSRRTSAGLPTPAPSESPDNTTLRPTPLADITSQMLNKQPATSSPKKGRNGSQIQDTDVPLAGEQTEVPIRVREDATVAAIVPEVNAQPKSRLTIRQLVMTNFKSYAGRQLVGPFHHSFSSVVGPNGSGKSNVIDSLLFVFGFRASKMRQGKISALIHNSAQHQNLDFCEVEVHFHEVIDRPDGSCEIVPDSAMVVSRKAFKNNSSTYHLNGKTTNFTTVTTLLKDRGIDLDHKRFLILQGEVESIAQMKPKAQNEHDDGLLEYLEDIIGTSKYKQPIEDGRVELEELEEVCLEKQGRVKHVEKERDALENKKKIAIDFVNAENDYTENQSALYQLYRYKLEKRASILTEEIDQTQLQMRDELDKYAGNENSIQGLEKEYKKAAKLFEQVEKQTQDFLKELARYDKESVKFEEKRKFIVNKQKKAEKLVTSSKSQASEARGLVQNAIEAIEVKTAEAAKLEERLQEEEAELGVIREKLRGKTQGFSDQIAAKQKSLEPWTAKISQKQSSLLVAQSELDILTERANAGQNALDEAESRVEDIKSARAQKEAEIDEKRHAKRRLEKDIRKMNDALQKLAYSEPDARERISTARQRAEEARASLSTTQNQSVVLKGLMRLKDSGRINGFHGRLGNLGTIDDKYDVAISTACPSLENMVVDSVEVGQQCIEYLRKNNLGRANFILLDRLARKDLTPMQTPENVPRLFDLVRPKEEIFRPAFYSIMHNTLVARDLEQANRIAYGAKRWRVVTLDGQLIDVSGTMSGGGTRVARGAMSSKLAADVTKEHVVQLEAERDELETTFHEFQKRQRELETMIKDKEDAIPLVETEIQKLQLEIDNAARKLSDAEKRVQDLGVDLGAAVKDNSQVEHSTRRIEDLNADIEVLKSETVSIEAEIQALQNKIMDVGGIQLRTQKGQVDSLKEQISLLADEIATAEGSKLKNEKMASKHEKAKQDAEKELGGLSADLEKLEVEMKAQKSDANASRQQAEQAQEELETKKHEIEAMKKELDDQRSQLDCARAQEIEMKNKLKRLKEELAKHQHEVKHWTEKLSKLVLHEIPDLSVPVIQRAAHTAIQVSEEGDEEEVNSEQRPVEELEAPDETEQSCHSLPVFTPDELEELSEKELKGKDVMYHDVLEKFSTVDLEVIAEYKQRCQDLASKMHDFNVATKHRDSVKARYRELKDLRYKQFMEGFRTISMHLKQMYQLITLGGNAELELVDSLDPFAEGILFSVMPPKKSWKNISNLSGGEKTLSSLALVFALHVYRPTPLYVMDEIDAALDFRNVSIIAGYIKERTKHAQFIVISLRNNMFELAERLIGIYKVNHMTKSVTVDNKDYIPR